MLMENLRSVRVLAEVEAEGSFSAAARSLGLSQSAVSQHVAALEARVGATLVERGTRPVVLTEPGHAVVRHGRAALARLESAEQELAEIAGRREGRLRLGSFPTALTTFVPAALARFRRERPATSLTVVDDHLQRLLPRLDDGELDLAIVYEHPVLDTRTTRDLERVALLVDEFVLVLPSGHALAGGPVPDLAALARDTWVGGTPGSAWFQIVREGCRAVGFAPRVGFASDDYSAVVAFVAAGLGVALVPGLAAVHPAPGVTVVRVRAGAPARRIVAVRPRDAMPTASAQVMLEALAASPRPFRLRDTPTGGVTPRGAGAPAR